jgi:hypothetical protein
LYEQAKGVLWLTGDVDGNGSESLKASSLWSQEHILDVPSPHFLGSDLAF